ncbi:hypothetical protein WN55_11284 [Dufourea novaeangliae]|uniref:Uncharacterized protein n=1 Tax=Dufourea novaeangliae TaxID=178035 RepID=A0A154PAB2_DUFNO|nr:hypothetical protein WN55_11284 [Dufourea novaeangliae]
MMCKKNVEKLASGQYREKNNEVAVHYYSSRLLSYESRLLGVIAIVYYSIA